MKNRWWAVLLLVVLISSAATVVYTVSAARSATETYPTGEVSVPSVINYQGYLTSPDSGQPVADNNYQMTFRLYDTSTQGTTVWQEQQTVAVSGGLFNVLLGAVAPFTGNEFSGKERWLEVQLDTEIMLPRQQLAAVPFAFQARNAGRLQGKSPGDLTSRITATGKQKIVLSNYPGFRPLAQITTGTTGPGTILVEATGSVSIQGPGTYADLGISANASSVEWANRAGVPEKSATGVYSWPFAVSHVFEVTGDPSNWYTYYFNGHSFGVNNSATVDLESFRAVYIPTSTEAPLPSAGIAFQGLRAQALPFNIPMSKLQTPEGITTRGTLAYDATGPQNPFNATKAYRYISSPKPGVYPYAAMATSHTGFNSLAGINPQSIEWDFQGCQIVETNIQNILSEGPIPLSDERIKRTDNMVFFKNADAGGRNSEKRTYAGGTFKIWNTATSTIIASGEIDYVSIILDWSGANQHTGWGKLNVTGPADSAFYNELGNVFKDTHLTMSFNSMQFPAGQDSPVGAMENNIYVIFSNNMTLKAGTAP